MRRNRKTLLAFLIMLLPALAARPGTFVPIELGCLLGFGGHRLAAAQEMTSQNFKIQGGNFNMTSGTKVSTNFKLSDVVGQTAANFFTSKGYFIQAGFLNAAAGEVFSFSISPLLVDFGTLSPNAPVERIIRISIANGNIPGYRVFMAENQPLATSVGAEIADTVCDSDSNPCTAQMASAWRQASTYGFGYRIKGKTTPVDFGREDFFRPFPARKRNEQPAIIMETSAKKVVDQTTMTLKVNIGPHQPVGQYRNVISFTAVAGI